MRLEPILGDKKKERENEREREGDRDIEKKNEKIRVATWQAKQTAKRKDGNYSYKDVMQRTIMTSVK